MKKRMKKITAMLLTAVMTLSLLPAAVMAETEDYVIEEAVEAMTMPYNTTDTPVYGNITLPDLDFEDVGVFWSSSHPDIVDVEEHENENYDSTPAGLVTRPERDTVVKLTAFIDNMETIWIKEFVFTVKAAPAELTEDDLTDYFFGYFAGEGYSNGEQIYFAASQDGLNWTDLNDNEPVLISTLGEKGVRDPFIIRSAEGDKFFMIATDLKINGGKGWGAAQTAGSQSIMVWESTDLVNWSEQRMVPISASIDSGCTWAPEAYYDAVTGEYIVFWASKVKADNYSKQRMYYAKTRDFYSFTEPEVFMDLNQSSIDTTVMYDEETEMYYRYTKNEGGSKNQFGANARTVFAEKAPRLLDEWTFIESSTLNSNGGVEGPSIFKFNKDDTAYGDYCLLLDNYGAGGYYPVVTDDISSAVYNRPSAGYKMPSRARHGTPVQVTAEEYENVMAVWGPQEGLNKGLLETKIDKAWEVDASLYTKDSYDEFENAIYEAEAELDYVETMEDVKRAADALDAAYDLLVPELEYIEAMGPDYGIGLGEDIKDYLVVTAVYADGTTGVITDGYEISGYDPEADAHQEITVSYEGYEAVVVVTVGDPVVELPYTDVTDADWFYDDVCFNYENGIMTGMTDTTFGPYAQLSRAQFALILYRMMEEPDFNTEKAFLDIAGDEWYGPAVLWAAECGIVSGYEDGYFGPADMITREQMAVMMYRFAKYLEWDVSAEGVDLSTFADGASVSEFAADAMKWVVDSGIITGKDGGTKLDPQGNTARCEAAAIIMRFVQ